MAIFNKKTWKARVTQRPNQRKLTKQDGSVEVVTVQRDEGTVTQEGDAFNAANMNDLENRISAFNDLIVVQEAFNEALTVNASGQVSKEVPVKPGYLTIALSTTYEAGSALLNVILDRVNVGGKDRLLFRNVSGATFTGNVTVNLVYLKQG